MAALREGGVGWSEQIMQLNSRWFSRPDLTILTYSEWLLKKWTDLIRKINLIIVNIDGIYVKALSCVDRPSPPVKLKQFTTLSSFVHLIESSSNTTCKLDPLPT